MKLQKKPMMATENKHFILPVFEGSLEFLLSLVQRQEIDLRDIPLLQLVNQFLSKMKCEEDPLECGSEFIAVTSYLVWLKTRLLLPSHEASEEEAEEEEIFRFELIRHLMDYSQFKLAAKNLSERQDKQSAHFVRGVDIPEWKKPLGIDHISLEELSRLFSQMIAKVEGEKKLTIPEESWRVSDKIKWMRHTLEKRGQILFKECFSLAVSKLEMIVIFLALLELMKMGELSVGKESLEEEIWVFNQMEKSKNEPRT